MKSYAYHWLLLMHLAVPHGEARQWKDVIDPDIYLQQRLDTNRYQLKIELDPFFNAGEEFPAPSAPPYNQGLVTMQPTNEPSMAPSNVPTASPTLWETLEPTTRDENVEGNGGCHNGTYLFRVNMYDSWGDGWDDATKLTITGIYDEDSTEISGSTIKQTHTTQEGDTTVSISHTVELTSDHPFGIGNREQPSVESLGVIFEGALKSGRHSSGYVCLVPKRCYEVTAFGGSYLDEVSWDITPIVLGALNETSDPFLEGGAPTDCVFSLPDENGEFFCTPSCSSTVDPSQTKVPDTFGEMTLVEGDVSQFTLETRGFGNPEAEQNGQSLLSLIKGKGEGNG